MANQVTPVVKATDSKVLDFFDELTKRYGFQPFRVRIGGADGDLTPDHPLISEIRSGNGYSAVWVQAIKNNQCNVTYARNQDPNRFAKPDQISFTNNNNAIDIAEAFRIDELINKYFLNVAPTAATLHYDENAFQSVIASHQEIVTRLEQSLELVSRHFTQERLKLQSEQSEFMRQKQEEFAVSEKQIRDAYLEKETVLAGREKELDDRANTHARRAIRADMKKRLQEHATRFTLTDKTRRLRWPIHVTVLVALAVLMMVIGFYATEYDTMASLHRASVSPWSFYPLLAKAALLTIAALGLLAWYIRWMNRWFDQFADAEFNLKQFELDVDRASWVVETAMEWRASQHGVIPAALLDSISRNLFSRKERERDEELHPADYLASALLGNASHARLKFGDAELDYNRGAIRKAAKTVEGE